MENNPANSGINSKIVKGFRSLRTIIKSSSSKNIHSNNNSNILYFNNNKNNINNLNVFNNNNSLNSNKNILNYYNNESQNENLNESQHIENIKKIKDKEISIEEIIINKKANNSSLQTKPEGTKPPSLKCLGVVNNLVSPNQKLINTNYISQIKQNLINYKNENDENENEYDIKNDINTVQNTLDNNNNTISHSRSCSKLLIRKDHNMKNNSIKIYFKKDHFRRISHDILGDTSSSNYNEITSPNSGNNINFHTMDSSPNIFRKKTKFIQPRNLRRKKFLHSQISHNFLNNQIYNPNINNININKTFQVDQNLSQTQTQTLTTEENINKTDINVDNLNNISFGKLSRNSLINDNLNECIKSKNDINQEIKTLLVVLLQNINTIKQKKELLKEEEIIKKKNEQKNENIRKDKIMGIMNKCCNFLIKFNNVLNQHNQNFQICQEIIDNLVKFYN